MTLKGKVALVTGAAGNGMGRSIALTLARDGADVIVNYNKSMDSAHQVTKAIQNAGSTAIAVSANITKKDDCKHLIDKSIERYGKIDICIISPGGGWHPENIAKLEPNDGMDDIIAEISPIYNILSLVLTNMAKNKWGRIIALSVNPSKPSPAISYNIAKAARTQAILTAYEQVWSSGITMNVIAPGPVTALPDLETAQSLCSNGKEWDNRQNITPQDIAETVSFLCSEKGRYITGCVIPFMFN